MLLFSHSVEGYIGIYPELTQTVVRPILQPFCDGLWEPFDGFIGSFKRDMYTYIGVAAVTGLVAGFGVGRYGPGGGRGTSKK